MFQWVTLKYQPYPLLKFTVSPSPDLNHHHTHTSTFNVQHPNPSPTSILLWYRLSVFGRGVFAFPSFYSRSHHHRNSINNPFPHATWDFCFRHQDMPPHHLHKILTIRTFFFSSLNFSFFKKTLSPLLFNFTFYTLCYLPFFSSVQPFIIDNNSKNMAQRDKMWRGIYKIGEPRSNTSWNTLPSLTIIPLRKENVSFLPAMNSR